MGWLVDELLPYRYLELPNHESAGWRGGEKQFQTFFVLGRVERSIQQLGDGAHVRRHLDFFLEDELS